MPTPEQQEKFDSLLTEGFNSSDATRMALQTEEPVVGSDAQSRFDELISQDFSPSEATSQTLREFDNPFDEPEEGEGRGVFGTIKDVNQELGKSVVRGFGRLSETALRTLGTLDRVTGDRVSQGVSGGLNLLGKVTGGAFEGSEDIISGSIRDVEGFLKSKPVKAAKDTGVVATIGTVIENLIPSLVLSTAGGGAVGGAATLTGLARTSAGQLLAKSAGFVLGGAGIFGAAEFDSASQEIEDLVANDKSLSPEAKKRLLDVKNSVAAKSAFAEAGFEGLERLLELSSGGAFKLIKPLLKGGVGTKTIKEIVAPGVFTTGRRLLTAGAGGGLSEAATGIVQTGVREKESIPTVSKTEAATQGGLIGFLSSLVMAGGVSLVSKANRDAITQKLQDPQAKPEERLDAVQALADGLRAKNSEDGPALQLINNAQLELNRRIENNEPIELERTVKEFSNSPEIKQLKEIEAHAQLRGTVDDIIEGKLTIEEVENQAESLNDFPEVQKRLFGIVETFKEADIKSRVDTRAKQSQQVADKETANKIRAVAAGVSGLEAPASTATQELNVIKTEDEKLSQEIIDQNIAKILAEQEAAEADDSLTQRPVSNFEKGLHALSRNELIAEVKRKNLSQKGVVQKPDLIEILVQDREELRRSVVDRKQTTTLETSESLTAKSNRRLQEQAEGLGLSSEGNKQVLVNRILEDQAKLDNVKTKAELDNSSPAELTQIAKDLSIKPTGNRRALVKKILKAQENLVQDVEDIGVKAPTPAPDAPVEEVKPVELETGDSITINNEEFAVTESDDENVELTSVDGDTVFVQPKDEPLSIDQGTLQQEEEVEITPEQEEEIQRTVEAQPDTTDAIANLVASGDESLKARLDTRRLSTEGDTNTLAERLFEDLLPQERASLSAPGLAAEAVSTPSGTTFAPTIGGESIPPVTFELAPRSENAGDQLVPIDVKKFQAQFEKTDPDFVIPADKADFSQQETVRTAAVEKFLKEGKPMQASEVTVLEDGGVRFTDGRNRFGVLNREGFTVAQVAMDAESRANAEKAGLLSTEKLPLPVEKPKTKAKPLSLSERVEGPEGIELFKQTNAQLENTLRDLNRPVGGKKALKVARILSATDPAPVAEKSSAQLAAEAAVIPKAAEPVVKEPSQSATQVRKEAKSLGLSTEGTQAEVTARIDASQAASTTADLVTSPTRVETQESTDLAFNTKINDAMLKLSEGATGRVMLADLRNELSDVPTSELSAKLIELKKQEKLLLFPLENPQEITKADEAAGIFTAGRINHIAIVENDSILLGPAHPEGIPGAAADRFIDTSSTEAESTSQAFQESEVQDLLELDEPTDLDLLEDEDTDSRDFVSLEDQMLNEMEQMEEDGNFEVC
jgi:hypothetical protein